MIKIGVVNIDTSHPKAFSDYILMGQRARYWTVYNDGFRGDDEVEGFMQSYGLEKRCATIAELADNVDIGFIQGCNWNKHLDHALPFIERNKPVFIDKPIVGNISDCRRLEELTANGAVILGSSSVRYSQEIVDFLNKPEDERGGILQVFGTSGVDEFNYGIHVVEAIGGLLGTGAETVRFCGASQQDGLTCETFFVDFSNGVTACYNTFQGTWQPFDIVIMTTKTTFAFRIDTKKIYGALLDRLCDYMETGKSNLADTNTLIESIKIMLAGRISRENGGEKVALADIPEDDPGYDGSAFEDGYAKAARKIYA